MAFVSFSLGCIAELFYFPSVFNEFVYRVLDFCFFFRGYHFVGFHGFLAKHSFVSLLALDKVCVH